MNRFCRSCCVRSRGIVFGFTLILHFLLPGCDANSSNHEQSVQETNQQTIENELLDPAVSTQASDFADASTASDALEAPSAPMLSIRAETEVLIFQWTHDQKADWVRLFQFDRQTGDETLLGTYSADNGNTLQLPSKTPHRRWNDELFRIELCTAELCSTSERIGIAGLTIKTSHNLRPSVFIENERYADSFTLNANTSVLISALPVSGAIDIYLRSDDQWVRTQRYRLPMARLSETRQLLLSSSANGNTIAILEIDTQPSATTQLTILERLGESWIASATWPIDSTEVQNLPATEPSQSRLQISDDGDRLLLQTAQTFTLYLRDSLAWSIASTLSLPENRMVLAVLADSSFNKVVSLERESGGLWLSHWLATAENWQQTSRHPISGIKPSVDIGLALNVDASKLMISGWEDVESSQRTPVAWRFNVSPAELQAQDSLRSAPAWDESAQLRFSASRDLDSIGIGWNNTPTNDALIHTYQYSNITGRWRKALQLPENIPTLAKQAFAGTLRISGDGNTLLIANPNTSASDYLNRVGELLIYR